MKIGTHCKHCGAYNLVYNKSCVECGAELVKFCPKCKSANFPNASICRKCGTSFKNKPQKDIQKSKLTPPRQFVLPEISKHATKRKKQLTDSIIQETKNIQRSSIIDVNPNKAVPSDAPILPLKEILANKDKMLSEKTSSKKVSNSSKQLTNKKKVKKVKKKVVSAENEALQLQLNTLQTQLSGLQQQFNTLPQQLNAMQMHAKPEATAEPDIQPDIIDKKPKSNQKSVLPKSSKNVTNKKVSSTHPKIKITNGYKGILPLKSNILPNSKNVIPNPRKLKKSKNILSEASNRQFKITEPKPAMDVPIKKEPPANGLPEYSPNLFTQASAKNILVNTLLNTSVSIISLSGESGIGKNIVLRSTIEALKENQFVWLIGKATPLSQITPCGLFQDILLTFFNVTNFCLNTTKLKKESLKFFKTEFPTLKNDEIDDLINFLYPEKSAYYENIFKNKARTFSILRKVFDTITSRMQTVFVFDNFEHIDNMSYEFLKTLINGKTGLQNAKYILTYNEPRSAKTYLYDKTLTDNSYTDISLIPFNDSQTDTFINQYNPLFVGTSQVLRDTIHKQTNGNPAYIEQILNLVTDSSRNYISFSLPETFEDVVKRRLSILKNENSMIYEILIASAVLGLKFYPVILNQLFKVDDRAFVEMFSSLLDLN